MAELSPWSPYVFTYKPTKLIVSASGQPVATVDTVLRLAPGYRTVDPNWKSGLSGAMPETPVFPRYTIVDQAGNLVATIEGKPGKVYPGFIVRDITPGEAALSGLGDNEGVF
jgi:hypothetical protein